MAPAPLSRAEIDLRVGQSAFLIDLLDHLPDAVVFLKDGDGRFVSVNETLVRRLGLRDKRQAIGRTALDLFPAPLGAQYLAQDLAVLRDGASIVDLLELHLYPGGHQGWCVTTKAAVRGGDGAIIGLAGMSRDVSLPDPAAAPLPALAEAVRLIREEFAKAKPGSKGARNSCAREARGLVR